MSEHDKWHWQEPGKAWKGVGIYHITMVVASRKPLLGNLVIPDNDPKLARVDRTDFGDKLVDCLWTVPKHHPEIWIISFDLMPDHIHTIWRVMRPMKTGIKSVVRGFWQAAKQIGREYSMSIAPNDIRDNEHRALHPIFSEKPFIRLLSHKDQLNAMIRYTWLNPQRLATKLLMPGFFRIIFGVNLLMLVSQRHNVKPINNISEIPLEGVRWVWKCCVLLFLGTWSRDGHVEMSYFTRF